MNRINKRGYGLRAVALTAVLSAALTACSSSSGTDGDASAESAAYAETSQTLLDTARTSAITGPAAGIVPAEDLTEWKTEDIPAPVAPASKPLTVAVITVYPVGFPIYGAALMKAIGGELGWNVRGFQAATPDPQGAQAAINQAILTKPDAIVTLAVPSAYVSQGLADAKSKGIPTIAVHSDSSASPGFDAYVPASEGIQKALLGAYAVAEGAGEITIVSSPPFADANVPAVNDYLEGCDNCRVANVEFSPDVFNDQTKMPTQLASAIKSPTTDFVIFPNGSIPLEGALNGIKASRAPGAQLLINNPGPPAMQNLKDSRIPVAVNIPGSLLVLTAIDDINRIASGEPALAETDLRMPVTYWTTEDGIEPTWSAMTAAQVEQNDFVSPFESAWGIKNLKDLILGVEG